jgi:23S rRNA pseudouridine1911/1915/1917 synthase
MIIETHQIDTNQNGKRIDQAAVEAFPGYSRARLQLWIKNGQITLDGRTVMPKHKVAGGEVLRLAAEPDKEKKVIAQNIALDVIHEDEHILVLNKPSGLVVHPAAGHPDGTLQNGLLHFDPLLASIPRSGIVHRLDKDTSGVMVVARSLKAHNSLVSQLQSRNMGRIYRAVLHGIAPMEGTVNAPIGRNPHDRQKMAVVPTGKPATSHYRLLNAFEHFSYVSVALESGRTHQIRVHMKHIGYPLVGDNQYGMKMKKTSGIAQEVIELISVFPRQALHARTLKLAHPHTGVTCEYRAPLPEDFAELLRSLEKHYPDSVTHS